MQLMKKSKQLCVSYVPHDMGLQPGDFGPSHQGFLEYAATPGPVISKGGLPLMVLPQWAASCQRGDP